MSVCYFNVLKVLLLALLHQLVGFCWYSPWVFGYKWLQLSGLSPLSIERNGLWPLGVSFGASIVMICVLAWLFAQLKVARVSQGVWVALLCWFAFSFCVAITHAAFEQTPFSLIALNLGKDFVLFLLTAVALFYGFKFRSDK